MSNYIKYPTLPSGGVSTYSNMSQFPVTSDPGALAVDKSTGILYRYFNSSWIAYNLLSLGSPSNGLTATNGVLTLEQASGSASGSLTSSDWTTFNNKSSTAYVDSSHHDVYYHYPVTSPVAENDIVMNIISDVNGQAPLAFKQAVNNGDSYYPAIYGVAKNVSGGFADVWVGKSTVVPGFSFGVFIGVDYYLDSANPGKLTWTPPVVGSGVNPIKVGRALDATHLILDPIGNFVQLKGGLYTSDGSYDEVLTPGTNGNVLVADSTQAYGLKYAPAIVAANPFTYTAATRTLTLQSQSANTFLAAPNGSSGAPTARLVVAADIPTLNQNTTGSAATWTTTRNLAGNSVNGSTNVAFANKFVVQGTADAGLSSAQFLGALGTGIVKNTTTTGVLSIAVAGDFPTLNQNTTGNSATATTAINATTATNFSGPLTGDVTGTQGATAMSAATVTGKLITGFVSGSGVVAATDTILQALNKLNGNVALKAPLASPMFTGDVNASTGNVLISTLGNGLQIKTGTNSKIGTAVLVAGTVTVANTNITANSRIMITSQTDGGTPGFLRVSSKTAGTNFVIKSSSATDTSTVAWVVLESIP